MRANGGDHRLQIVAIFSRDANLLVLDLCRHFQFRFADESGDLLGYGRLNALLDFNRLPFADWFSNLISRHAII